MPNARLLSVSHGDTATITASPTAAISQSNLADTDVSKPWRSREAVDQIIDFDFGAAKNVNVIYLGNINFSSCVVMFSSDAFATVDHVEEISAFANDLAHKDAILWLTGASGGDYVVDGAGDYIVDGNGDRLIDQAYSNSLPISARYMRLFISGATASYFEIGRVKVGEYFDAPNSRNVGIGPSVDYVERGALVPTRGGGFRSESKIPQRVVRVRWDWIHPTDAYALAGDEFAEMLRVTGHRGDVLLSVYPAESETDRERLHTVLGRITDRSSIDGTDLINDGAGVQLYSSLSIEVTEAI